MLSTHGSAARVDYDFMSASLDSKSPHSGLHHYGALTSISRSGRVAAFRRHGALELRETNGEGRTTIDTTGHVDFGFGAGGLWLLAGGYVHWMTEEGRSRRDCSIGEGTTHLAASRGALPSCVLGGKGAQLCELYDNQLFTFSLAIGTPSAERIFPVGPRLLAVTTANAFRLLHLEQGTLFSYAIPERTFIRTVCPIYGGAAIAVIFGGVSPAIWLLTPSGDPFHQVPIGQPDLVAVAEDRGIVVIGTGQTLCAIDLRYGEHTEWARTPFPIEDIDICARARELVVAQRQGYAARTWHVRYDDIFAEA